MIIKHRYFVVSFISIVVILASFYLSGAMGLEKDNNLNEPSCELVTEDCDNIENACVAKGLAWTPNDYPATAGNPNCCGDDSNEWTHTLHCRTGSSDNNEATSWCVWVQGVGDSTSPPTKSCCDTPLLQDGGMPKCTGIDGVCHDAGTEMQFYFSGNDQTVYCYDSSGFNIGDDQVFWADCDRLYGSTKPTLRCSALLCGNTNGIYAGEINVGEYTNVSVKECCGDDSGEYYINSFCSGYSGPAKCCNSTTDKIDKNGRCVKYCLSSIEFPTTPYKTKIIPSNSVL